MNRPFCTVSLLTLTVTFIALRFAFATNQRLTGPWTGFLRSYALFDGGAGGVGRPRLGANEQGGLALLTSLMVGTTLGVVGRTLWVTGRMRGL